MIVIIALVLRRRGRTTALPRPALISTLEQARVRLADTTRFAGDAAGRVGRRARTSRAVEMLIARVRAAAVVVVRVEAELGLDGGGVDAVGVQAAAHRFGQFHVPRGTLAFEVEFDLDVQAADQLGVAQLPDVHVVAGHDARQVFDVRFDVFHVDADGDGLQEDARGGFAERDGGGEDYGGDDQGDGRVHVEAPAVVREPDEEGGGDDADVAEGVAQDVEEDAAHVEVAVRVAVAALGLLFLGLGVSVLLVVDGLALGAAVAGVLAAQERLVRRSVGVSVVFVVVCDLFVVGAVFRLEIFHAAGRDDRLAESVRVDVNVVKSRVP